MDAQLFPLLLAGVGPLLLVIVVQGLPRLALTLPQVLVVLLLAIVVGQLFLIAGLLLAIVLRWERPA